jgi:hypothetical protein
MPCGRRDHSNLLIRAYSIPTLHRGLLDEKMSDLHVTSAIPQPQYCRHNPPNTPALERVRCMCHDTTINNMNPITQLQPGQPRLRQCHIHPSYTDNCPACNDLTPPTSQVSSSTHPYTFAFCQCYRCQRARKEPYMHPLVGTAAGICTAGLSSAAFGIYRGVTMSRRAKKARKDSLQNRGDLTPLQQQMSGTSSTSSASRIPELPNPEQERVQVQAPPQAAAGDHEYATPSPISAASAPTTDLIYLNTSNPTRPVSELDDTSPTIPRSKASELDSSPVTEGPAPPRYIDIMGVQGKD